MIMNIFKNKNDLRAFDLRFTKLWFWRKLWLVIWVVSLAIVLLGGGEIEATIKLSFFIILFLSTYKMFRLFNLEKELRGVLVAGKNFIDNITEFSSYPNTLQQLGGYTFSTIEEIRAFSTGKGVFLDRFTMYPEAENITKPNLIKEVKQTKIFVDPLDLTKTVLTLGSMGSGKTEFFHSLLNQSVFNRAIIHDVKGDFVEKWYNPKTDFIFNPYDSRGFYWDLWEEMKENEAFIESFFANVLQSETEEKDFFTSSAKKVVINEFLRVHHILTGATTQEKWKALNKALSAYETKGADDKTKASIYATMELVIDLFEFFEYQSNQTDIKHFTIKDFLNSNGKLFLLNNPSVSKKLNPLFAGFTALLSEKLLSRADTKTDLTMILLDEYLSLNFDKQTRTKLLTQVRSKGGCLILGLQYLPKKDKEHQQLLDSSCYAKIIFKINDNETVKHLIDSMGDIEYMNYSESTGKNGKGGGKMNKQTKTKKFLTPEMIQSMPDYTHITMVLSKKIVYLGYTDVVSLTVKNNNFIKKDLSKFYDYKFNVGGKSETEAEIKKEDNLLTDGNGEQYNPDKTEKICNRYDYVKRLDMIEEYLAMNEEEKREFEDLHDFKDVSLAIFLQEN